MKVFWLRGFVFMGVLGLLGLTPARATHTNNDKHGNNNPIHEDQPRPPVEQSGGFCTVVGTANINNDEGTGGVGTGIGQRDHNHYRLQDVIFSCTGLAGFNGVFAVNGAGATDGPGECDGNPGTDSKCHNDTHGEELTAGWSHGDCYARDCQDKKDAKGAPDDIYKGTNTNPSAKQTCSSGAFGETCNLNEIVLTDSVPGTSRRSCQGVDPGNPDDEECENWLKFCRGTHSDHGIQGGRVQDCQNMFDNDGNPRVGTYTSTGGGNALAWAALTDWDHPALAKDTVLCLLGSLEFQPVRVKANNKVDQFAFDGRAQIWLGTPGDVSSCDGKKN